MKKYLFLFLISILTNQSVNSQITEYIDLTTKGVFGRSEMVVYNDNLDYDDLEYLYLGPNNDNYHWVKYTNAKDVIITMSDSYGDKRELCTKQGNDSTLCEVVGAYAATYRLRAKDKIFQVWISKINVKTDKSY